jgi:hypothetical protein
LDLDLIAELAKLCLQRKSRQPVILTQHDLDGLVLQT